MFQDNWKLILFIVLPVCLAVVAFIVVAILVRCLRRRKAAKQARRVIPDLWIHHSQELPLYAVECPLSDQPNEQLPSPKADLSTICEVLQSYVPQSPKELHLEKGEFLKVVEKDCNGWCRGVMGTDIGWFPGSYVKEIRTASLIEASEEETERETPTLQRLKPRVSSFMIKKRVSKDIQDNNFHIDDQQMSRSHSELTDTISLPRSRTSTAGSSSVGEAEHIRFQQRSPSILLDIPGRLQNGYADQRLSVGSLSQNQRDNNNNAQRRLSSRRVEPPSLLLQIPIQGRTTPLLRPTRPAPPPPPSRKPIRSVSPSSTATSPLTETTPITPLTPTLLQTPAEEADVIVTTLTLPPTIPATTQLATTEGVAAAAAAAATAPAAATTNPVIIGIDGKEDATRTTAIPPPPPPLSSLEPNLESNPDNQLELTNHLSTPLIQSQENVQMQSKIVNDVAPSGSLENGIEPLTEPLLQAETQCLPLSHYPNQLQTDSCET
ncbi:uncharacterized protein LOC106868072 isoform X1 [Octopus bimaculoides]|nr:uncharacterized protein LOC106868072 isoform X1 [Octopus bimaculoides]